MGSEPSRPGRAAIRRAGRVILSPPIQVGSMARMKNVGFGSEITRRQDSTLTARLRRRCRVTKPPAQFTTAASRKLRKSSQTARQSCRRTPSLPARKCLSSRLDVQTGPAIVSLGFAPPQPRRRDRPLACVRVSGRARFFRAELLTAASRRVEAQIVREPELSAKPGCSALVRRRCSCFTSATGICSKCVCCFIWRVFVTLRR